MSDEHREPARDESASTERSHTDQHPVPSYAMAGPGQGESQNAATQTIPGYAPVGGPYPGASYPPPPAGPPAAPPSDGTPGRPRKQRTMAGIVTAAVLAGIVGGGAGFGGAYALLDHGSTQGTVLGSAASTSNAVNAAPGTVTAAAQAVMPSTVDIRVNLPQGTAEGSGVILTADGNVLTNNHVVAGGNGTIEVTLADGSRHPATVVGTSPSYDLAVLKVQGVSGLSPATLGQSSSVQVGAPVVAIGSPQGLTGTVTSGIVSALNRTVEVQGESGGNGVVYNGLQTDAAINQGNSGGPLVNLDGQVIGINSAIATAGQSTGSIGLGFAIPVDQARRVAQEIIDTGSATKPMLGVQGNTSSSSTNGAPIAAVTPASPAANAGLTQGQVITKVGNDAVQNFSDLVARIGSYAPGQQVTLTVTDANGSNEHTVNVTLAGQPDKAPSNSIGGSTQNPNPFGRSPFGQNNPFGQNSPFGGGN